LYDAYVITLSLADADADLVLFIDQQQLALYTHSCQTRVILMLSDVNVLFVWLCIALKQV